MHNPAFKIICISHQIFETIFTFAKLFFLMRIRPVLIIYLLFVYVSIYGQKGVEVGGWLGGASYHGDLNTSILPKKLGLAGGLLYRRNFNTRVSIRAGLNFARIWADDARSDNYFERNRNLSFRSNIFDFTTGLEFNFFEYEHGSNDASFTPFLYGGFSIFNFNPKAQLNNEWHALRPLGTEGQDLGAEYGSISGGLTLGGGFKWDINREWSFNIDFSTRFLFTDYLDDVSTTYADNRVILSRRGPIAAALADRSLVEGIGVTGRQRGNSKDNDTYILFGIGIMRYFGGIECPKISEIRD